MYYLINVNEDGDVYGSTFKTKEEALDWIASDVEEYDSDYLKSYGTILPQDLRNSATTKFLFKGELIAPFGVKHVVKLQID